MLKLEGPQDLVLAAMCGHKQAEEASLQGGVWNSYVEGSSKDHVERERGMEEKLPGDFSILCSPAVLPALGSPSFLFCTSLKDP